MIQNPTLLLDDLLLDVIEPYYTLRCYRTLPPYVTEPCFAPYVTEPCFTLICYRTQLLKDVIEPYTTYRCYKTQP